MLVKFLNALFGEFIAMIERIGTAWVSPIGTTRLVTACAGVASALGAGIVALAPYLMDREVAIHGKVVQLQVTIEKSLDEINCQTLKSRKLRIDCETTKFEKTQLNAFQQSFEAFIAAFTFLAKLLGSLALMSFLMRMANFKSTGTQSFDIRDRIITKQRHRKERFFER